MIPDKIKHTLDRYNEIDEKHLKGKKILELGCGCLNSQLYSRHKKYFEKGDYLGIDMNPSKDLNTIKANILEINFLENSFDTIIMFEVIEHIDFFLWDELTAAMKSWIKPGGVIILSTRNRESPLDYKIEFPHVVFGIRKKTLRTFFPNMRIKTMQHPFLWGISKERKLRRLLRGLKRKITRHEFNFISLWGIWTKQIEE